MAITITPINDFSGQNKNVIPVRLYRPCFVGEAAITLKLDNWDSNPRSAIFSCVMLVKVPDLCLNFPFVKLEYKQFLPPREA